MLHIALEAHTNHGDASAKYFCSLDTRVVADAMHFSALRDMQDDGENMCRGANTAGIVEGKQLAVQTAPFSSIKNLLQPVSPFWREGLFRYVEEGKKFLSALVSPGQWELPRFLSFLSFLFPSTVHNPSPLYSTLLLRLGGRCLLSLTPSDPLP